MSRSSRLEPAPLVEPTVKFTLPSERVTTAAGNSDMAEAVAGLRNHLPLVRAIGFNGVESYVRWGWVEKSPGVYDWGYHDAILEEIEKHGLQWFPLLLAGSGYALPAWFHDSTNNVGFKCLEHGIVHDTQSIFFPYQAGYASRFIAEFGTHYGGSKALLGIRLGLCPPRRSGARLLPHCRALSLTPRRLALWMLCRLLWSAVSSSPRRLRGNRSRSKAYPGSGLFVCV